MKDKICKIAGHDIKATHLCIFKDCNLKSRWCCF